MIMKTFVLILVLLCVFIHTAEGLQCRRCYSYWSCDQTPQKCSGSQTFCFSRATTNSNGYERSTYHSVEKGCASHDMCTSTGSHVESYDIGYQAHVTNTTCCDTDNCNDADYSTPSPPAGPLQCYGCDPSRLECIANVTCRDHESCFQTSPSPYSGHQSYYGCISENVCSNSSLSTTLYGLNNVSCCDTPHCNVPELGIQCQTCVNYDCSSQRSVFCSNDATMCHSQYRSDTYPYGTYTRLEKGCASSEKCPSTGSHLSSHNIGSGSSLIYTSCCDTDNCNNNDTDVSVPPLGSLQCYGCDIHEDHCTANVTCREHETCFKSSTHYNNELHFGCISENVCSNSSLSTTLYGLNNVSCCDTPHCNVPELSGHKCMACSGYQCSSERSVFCTEDAPFCFSRTESYGSGYTNIQKGCVRSNICPATVENQVVSFQVGYNSYIRNTTCCDTDNCNVTTQTIPMIPAGSLQCYNCDLYSHECNVDTVTCNELEVCAMTRANSSPRIYGCVSENLCNNATMTQQHFGYYEEISCCDTDFCNNPNKCEDKDDGSVFGSAGPMLSLSVPLCLLGLFTCTF